MNLFDIADAMAKKESRQVNEKFSELKNGDIGMAKKSTDKTGIKSSRIQTIPGNNSISCDTSPILSHHFDMVHCNEYVTNCYIVNSYI